MSATEAAPRIRLAREADIPACEALREQAGWNQTPDDWRRLLAWEPDGCFVAERDGQVVATATTTVFGSEARLAWVGMMLVDASLRRRGLGRALLTHAVEYLEASRGVRRVGLDATPLGKTLYDQMGFVDCYPLQRHEGIAPVVSAPAGVRSLDAADVPRLAALDLAAFGADRLRVVADLIAAWPRGAFAVERDGAIVGYACSRPGARRWYVGPVVARDRETADRLFRAVFSGLGGEPIVVDTLDPNADAAELMRDYGLKAQRPFIRMARGGALPPGDCSSVYGGAGPEIG